LESKPGGGGPTVVVRTLSIAAILIPLAASAASAQWQILPAPTAADLRGIDNVGKGIAWASGTAGTVLRTTDDGKTWQRCATPPDADHLDFRGIQAFDANTAIVMSSGKGPLSRLYKTTDACQTWTLLFTNPDPEGFWDAIRFGDRSNGIVLGDPVLRCFRLWHSVDAGDTWTPDEKCPKADGSNGAFAASNSALNAGELEFVTGGPHPKLFVMNLLSKWYWEWMAVSVPLRSGSPSAGAYSIAYSDTCSNLREGSSASGSCGVIVGGDYEKPEERMGTAALTIDAGDHWLPAQTPPHGYRSAVAYSPASKTWITVGPNGTDISTDDGRNWRPLKPTASEPPDADQHWNALSLPFVVGPHGRIGRLHPGAIVSTQKGTKP
jgi:photosystem II stability/assembly factor-like uncharacterized protein